MKQQLIRPFLVFSAVFIFHQLFWQEQLGINTLLFTALVTALFWYLYPESFRSQSVQLTLLGSWLAAVMVVWHHSVISQVVYVLSMTVATGMVHRPQLRFLGYGFLLGVLSVFETPLKGLRNWSVNPIFQTTRWSRTFYAARMTVLPLLVVALFYTLYLQASTQFASLSNRWWKWVGSWLEWQLSIPQIVFFLFGALIIGGIMWKSWTAYFPFSESVDQEQLRRIKTPKASLGSFGLADLRKEYRMAVICMVALNALLVLFNLTDLNYVWFTDAPATASQLKAYVHEGTYVLIFSILLAMGLLLFFFRKHLNFYPDNQPLKLLAYAWVIQNAILVFSVAIRNYRYIDAFGLAYKRIGVIIFLLLVLYGLWSVLQKIKACKHSYFLFHRNAWAVYWVILLTTMINWDVYITRYNLTQQHNNPIDTRFLARDVSDKNLFLLLEQQEQFLQRPSYPKIPAPIRQQWLDKKIESVRQKSAKYSWLSWNYADYRNTMYLNDVTNSQ